LSCAELGQVRLDQRGAAELALRFEVTDGGTSEFVLAVGGNGHQGGDGVAHFLGQPSLGGHRRRGMFDEIQHQRCHRRRADAPRQLG
jgi:hypothetical protein